MSVRAMKDELVAEATARAVLSRVNLLAESGLLALDIGGNLAKLLYLQRHGTDETVPTLPIDRLRAGAAPPLSVAVPALGGTLHFFAFETRAVEALVAFIRQHWPTAGASVVRATGGGAYKYSELLHDSLGVTLAHVDEMASAVAGLNFSLSRVDGEAYVYAPPPTPPRSQLRPPPVVDCRRFVPRNVKPFPYLLVNIGSGVSVLKVTGHGKFERISGSALGGGTFWGLSRLLLNCSTFDDVIKLTNRGDHERVDMLVGDIYGGAYASLDLDAGVIASSFGKVTMSPDDRHPPTSWVTLAYKRFWRALRATLALWLSFVLALPVLGALLRAIGVSDPFASRIANIALAPRFRAEDVALSLLRMVAYNVGQIAVLNARLHDLERIYFGGNFVRNHPHTIADVSFAVNFWSGGKTQALFLKHDGFLGAIGAFIGGKSELPTKPEPSMAHAAAGSHAGVHKNALGEQKVNSSTVAAPRDIPVEKADVTKAEAVAESVAAKVEVAPQNGSSKSKSARARKARARAAAAAVAAAESSQSGGGQQANDDTKRGGWANGVNGYANGKLKQATSRNVDDGEWRTVVPRGKKKS